MHPHDYHLLLSYNLKMDGQMDGWKGGREPHELSP